MYWYESAGKNKLYNLVRNWGVEIHIDRDDVHHYLGFQRSYLMRRCKRFQQLHYTSKLLKVMGLGLKLDQDCMLLENTLYDILEDLRCRFEDAEDLKKTVSEDLIECICEQCGDEDFELYNGESFFKSLEAKSYDELFEELYDTIFDDMDFQILGMTSDEGIRERMGMLEQPRMRDISEERATVALNELWTILYDPPTMVLLRLKKKQAARKILRFIYARAKSAKELHHLLWKPGGPIMKHTYKKQHEDGKR